MLCTGVMRSARPSRASRDLYLSDEDIRLKRLVSDPAHLQQQAAGSTMGTYGIVSPGISNGNAEVQADQDILLGSPGAQSDPFAPCCPDLRPDAAEDCLSAANFGHKRMLRLTGHRESYCSMYASPTTGLLPNMKIDITYPTRDIIPMKVKFCVRLNPKTPLFQAAMDVSREAGSGRPA